MLFLAFSIDKCDNAELSSASNGWKVAKINWGFGINAVAEDAIENDLGAVDKSY